MAGAPIGNKNAAKAKVWHAAIMRALERRQPADQRIKAIDELADRLLDLVSTGDLAALKEFGDRMDGKAHQSVGVAGDEDGNPIQVSEIVIRGVSAASS